MSKHTVEVLDAIVDGKKKGEKLDIDTKSAKYLESIHYVKIIGPVKEENKQKDDEKKEDSDAEAKQGDSEGHEAQEKQKEKGQKKK
ncbi:hypothetical protein [Shouchella miscanthi]|uniref:hypothetical protein n=1 Tax=Shouchella miscanthi TaxID=2598861 RepID=UPI0011AA42ED|nr:hypothetical protein [Shouchella miscanthi]